MAISGDKRPHYLIVGAGVAGCSLAYELSKHEVDVTLVDAGRIGELGASAVPVALLNPHRGRTARASELDKAGLSAIWEVMKELSDLGLNHGIQKSFVLRIASSEKQARLWQKLKGVCCLESAIPGDYHAPFGGIMIQGGWLEPKLFLQALVEASRQRGVKVVENCRVQSIEKVSGFGFRVSLKPLQTLVPDPQPLIPDIILLCVGAGHIQGITFPELEYHAGDVVTFESRLNLPYPIAGAVYGLQHQDRVFIGGNHREAVQDDPAAVEQLQKSSSWFIPALKEAKVISKWTGTRVKQQDNQPLIAEIEPNLIFFGALGGRGFLCSSYLARLLVENLLES
jgi:glycine/D-amino acid oxidase-like deaminating enzyme